MQKKWQDIRGKILHVKNINFYISLLLSEQEII